MRVMVLVKATEDSEKGFFPTTETMEMMEAMGRFNDELRNAGILLAADGLKPSSQGAYWVRWYPRASRRLLALGGQGYGRDRRFGEALPNPMPGPSEIDIRPL